MVPRGQRRAPSRLRWRPARLENVSSGTILSRIWIDSWTRSVRRPIPTIYSALLHLACRGCSSLVCPRRPEHKISASYLATFERGNCFSRSTMWTGIKHGSPRGLLSQPSASVRSVEPRGFRVTEAASYMGLAPSLVELKIRSGELFALKLCRHWTILREDMDRFLDVEREKEAQRRAQPQAA